MESKSKCLGMGLIATLEQNSALCASRRVHLWEQTSYKQQLNLPIAQVDPVQPLGHTHPMVLLQLPPFIQLQVSLHS